MKKGMAVVVALALAMLFGCSKKPEAPKIAAWDQYSDPYFGLSFKYPQSWLLIPEGSKFSVYSSPDVINRFVDYTAKGKDGARLMISSQKMDTLKVLDKFVSNLKNDLLNSGYEVGEPESKTLADLPAIQLHYSGAIDRETRVEVKLITAMKDSNLYSIKFEAFNELFPAYQAVFDTAFATLRLPQAKTAVNAVDPSIPATEFSVFENNNLKISYPANFESFVPQPKAPVEFVMEIKGYRQDSFIHIDIMPAQGLSADKVVEQNSKFYKETSRGTATVDGVTATYINYSPVKDIQSRVYFVVKNDKIYRIIVNYYAPMKNVYLPAFEKTVSSLIAK
jgi:hypothetical protein